MSIWADLAKTAVTIVKGSVSGIAQGIKQSVGKKKSAPIASSVDSVIAAKASGANQKLVIDVQNDKPMDTQTMLLYGVGAVVLLKVLKVF